MLSNRLTVAIGSVLVFVLAGCASKQFRTDYNPQASFSQLRTYSWIGLDHAEGFGDPALSSPLLEARIQESVDEVLASRGYQPELSGEPDFRVSYWISASVQTTYRRSYGYSPYYGHRSFGHSHFGHHGYGYPYSAYGHSGYGSYYDGFGSFAGPVYARQNLRATLVLDIVDARTDELIWRGWASGVLAMDPKPERVQKFMSEAVQGILEKFPPDKGQESAPALVAP